MKLSQWMTFAAWIALVGTAVPAHAAATDRMVVTVVNQSKNNMEASVWAYPADYSPQPQSVVGPFLPLPAFSTHRERASVDPNKTLWSASFEDGPLGHHVHCEKLLPRNPFALTVVLLEDMTQCTIIGGR